VTTHARAALVLVAAATLGACKDRSPPAVPPAPPVQSPATVDTVSVPLFAGDTIPRVLQLADTNSVLMEDDLGGDAAGPWWALDRNNPASLRRVDIVVERVPHPCIADDTVRVGRTVSIAGGGDALTLLRGIPGLRPGPVVTGVPDSVYAAPESPAGGTDSARVTFAGRPLRIWRTGVGQGFQVEVEWDGRRDVLYTTDFEDEGSWDLVLVADINRDSGPDLLLQATPKYSLRTLRLLLFQPTAAQRYREVASSQQAAC
jgi:hypothetical protein